MNPINSDSKSFKRLNPHLYQSPNMMDRVMVAAAAKIPVQDRAVMNEENFEAWRESVAHGEMRQIGDEDKLNKTEKRYLAWLRTCGDKWIGIQNITLKIADDCRLTCDFAALDFHGLRLIDVKGFQREDALIKIKVAARMFPWIRFLIAKEREDKTWEHTEVKP